MENEPLVSVCCVTYNHAKYIRQALDSVLMQETDFPFEVLVHDDASTDGTADIVREYEQNYPGKVRAICQTVNQYSKDPRVLKNFVYPKAQGRYIALLECDDYWTDPQKLQRQVSYMERHSDCSGTFHTSNWVCGERIIGNDRHFDNECDVTPQQVILGGGEYCATGSLCFRAKYALDYPRFRQMDEIGDYSLEILLPLRGAFHYFPEIMCCYRYEREGSWTSDVKAHIDRRCHYIQIGIEWLKELDRETKHRYATEIYYKIGRENCVLYKNRKISFSELRSVLPHMKWGRLKLSMMRKCYERWLRAGILSLIGKA